MSRDVLFVSMDASRTGAPGQLLSALRWLDESGRLATRRCRVVLLDGGPLKSDLAAASGSHCIEVGLISSVEKVRAGVVSVGRSLPASLGDAASRLALRQVPPAGVVVANSVASLHAAQAVVARQVRKGGPVPRLVCHVHELDGVAARVLGSPLPAEALAEVDHFIAAGPCVKEMLLQRWGIGESLVTTVDPWLPAAPPTTTGQQTAGSDPPVVLAVGSMVRRKGPERFIDLMSALSHSGTQAAGIWLGGDSTSPVWAEVEKARLLSADPCSIELRPSVSDPASVIMRAAVVVSTAVEDPFPVTLLEAGALGIPIAGYDSGGIGAMLRSVGQEDALVPVGDLLGLARVVARLVDDSEERHRRGRNLSDWVLRSHLVEHQAPQWWNAVTS